MGRPRKGGQGRVRTRLTTRSRGRGRRPRPRLDRNRVMNSDELLPSWSQGDAKSAVLEFVESVSRPGASYVPPAERIATFDNDGTLWCEKPQSVQTEFTLRCRKQMIQADPAKAQEQPYKALAENDQAWLAGLLGHVPEPVKGLGEAYEESRSRPSSMPCSSSSPRRPTRRSASPRRRQPRVRLRHRRGEGSGRGEGTRLDGREHAQRLQGGV
jgi:hypothetical protein